MNAGHPAVYKVFIIAGLCIYVVIFNGLLSRVMGVNPIQRQSIIALIPTVGLTAFGLLSTMYFSHAIGPAPLGLYFLFLAYFGIFTMLGDFGFASAAVKRIAEDKEQSAFFSAYLAMSIGLIVVSVSLLILVQLFVLDLVGMGLFWWLLLGLIVIVFNSSTNVTLTGRGKVGISQISSLVNNSSKILIQILAVFLGFGAGGLIGGFIAGLVAGGLLNLKFFDLHLVRFEKRHISSLFAFSFWIFLSSGGILIFTYADTILLGYFMSEADVGIYRIAFQFTSVAAFTTLALNNTLYPRLSLWGAQSDLASAETALARAFTYALLLAVPVCVGGWILGDRLLFFLYGAAFTAGTPALFVLLAMQVAYVFMNLQTMSLNALDRPRDSFKVTAVASVVNVVLNLLLIPIFGIMGAALATLVTMILNAGLAYLALNHIIRVRVESAALRNILIAAAAMAFVTLLFRLTVPLTHVAYVLIAVAIGGLVYGVLLLKLDRSIHDELKGIAQKMSLPWPGWL